MSYHFFFSDRVITTAVQYAVDPRRVEDFYFKLNEPERQISAHVENVVRSQIPKMDLDSAFLAKDELAHEIKDELSNSMSPYGLIISNCLMTEMLPDNSVLMAMNEINAARRLREANIEKAEAEKVAAQFPSLTPPAPPETELPAPIQTRLRI